MLQSTGRGEAGRRENRNSNETSISRQKDRTTHLVYSIYIYIEHNKCHAFERIQNIYRVPNELFQLLESLRNLFYTFIIVHTRKRALTIFIGFIDDFS